MENRAQAQGSDREPKRRNEESEVGSAEGKLVVQFSGSRSRESRKNPVRRGCSSVGRAPALQAGGHGFESHHLHQGEDGIEELRIERSDRWRIAQQVRARA